MLFRQRDLKAKQESDRQETGRKEAGVAQSCRYETLQILVSLLCYVLYNTSMVVCPLILHKVASFSELITYITY